MGNILKGKNVQCQCKQCGEVFEPKRKKSRTYCSQQCSNTARNYSKGRVGVKPTTGNEWWRTWGVKNVATQL
jgi:hypothetical protein